MNVKKPHQNLDSVESDLKGIAGVFERTLRRFKLLMHGLALLPIAAIFVSLMGISLFPGIALFQEVTDVVRDWPVFAQYLAWGMSLAAGYFAYGFSMIVVVPTACFIMRAYPREFRGSYYSLETGRWYVSNGLLYLVRYSFLEFVTPTPFNNLFYMLMGMKLGRGVHINSTHISDPAMIEIGDKVTIGGSAVIAAHYGQAGYLVIAPVRIGRGATIGLRATIMGDVVIGEGARVLPNSVVLPKTRIPAGETWGGVPAVRLDTESVKVL
jgi:acetyltransferase-like isoleucine patch superfamily enzyme